MKGSWRSSSCIVFYVIISVAVMMWILGVAASIEVSGKRLASTTQIVLTAVFLITGSVQTLDKRLLQARRFQNLPADEPMLPTWVAIVYWLHYGVIIALFAMGWRYALVVVAIGFALAVLPVFETVGNVLMAPFRPQEPSYLYNCRV